MSTGDRLVGDRDVHPFPSLGQRVQLEHEFIPFDKAQVEQSIPERFAKQVLLHGDRLAVKTRTETLTYAKLNGAADRVAAALLAARSADQESIGLLFNPGVSLAVALLAVLKTGKVCVPLDPTIPPARSRTMLDDAQACLVLTDRGTLVRARELTEGVCPLLDIEAVGPCPAGADLAVPLSADSLACIVYTSGSTGQPKGVVHTHRTLLHQAMLYTNAMHIVAGDRFAFIGSPGAVGPIRFTLTAVLNGASLFPLDLRRDGVAELLKWLAQEEIAVLIGRPGIVRMLDNTLERECPRFPMLRLVSFGGEAIYRRDVEACRRVFPRAIVSVGLGTTETGSLTRYLLDKDTPVEGHVVPVGYPAEDKKVLVLGEDGRDVGVDAVGEIAVRSRYLSPGYWRRPDLTQAAFRPDPAGGPERLYLTGDLGRRLPDGCLVHLGRKDFQVKIRGFRVEVAEVEGALLSLPTIKEVVVVAREERPGEQRLVAYLVPKRRPAPTVSVLRRALAATLPDYMVPSAFVAMDTLPRTPAGKVDRLGLPASSRARPELDSPRVAPRTPVEATLCAIWGDVLRLDEVGIHDHFLDLGGNSLAASQALARITKTFGIDLPVRTLFETPTIAGIAAAIAAALERSPEREERGRILAELEGLSEAEAKRLLTRAMPQKGEESHE
jgi:amino acid adenylation domain-containing protein